MYKYLTHVDIPYEVEHTDSMIEQGDHPVLRLDSEYEVSQVLILFLHMLWMNLLLWPQNFVQIFICRRTSL